MSSTTPELSRSFQNVSLKVLRRAVFCGSLLEGLKSGTARRTFSTPSPEPVRTQSWANENEASSRTTAKTEVNRPKNLALAESVICLWLSSIRLEPLREAGQKDTAYNNIVRRYVINGNLLFIILTNMAPRE